MSADVAAHEAAAEVVIALERSCLEAEGALVERRWPDVERAFAVQAALTDALKRVFAAAPQTAPENDDKVARRMRGILAYRDDQLRRLRAYHAEIEERLRSIGKVRAFSRSIGKRERAGEMYDTKQ